MKLNSPLFLIGATAFLSLLPLAQAVPAPLQSSRPASDVRPVTFRFVADKPLKSVLVAGTFNNWDKGKNPLQKGKDGKTWSLTLNLEPDVYPYKFILNDGTNEVWITDPKAPAMNDGNGNTNSTVTVLPDGYAKRPGKKGDGQMTGSAVRHRSEAKYVVRLNENQVRLALRTRHNDVSKVTLETQNNRRFPMTLFSSNSLFDEWRVTASLSSNGSLAYAFRLSDGGTNTRLYDAGDWLVAGTYKPKWFRFDAKRFSVFKTPDWAKDTVFYQIFPDRFRNGDPFNDPKDVVSWGAKPTFFNWMGGDLAGVSEKLGYLKTLGISGIYFNPLFDARSNHGYDTNDYAQIHPYFGTNTDLKNLVSKAHEQKIRVVLDGVFNHTSVDFAQFASLRKEGASSPYRDWYFVKGFPLEVKDGQQNYVGWFGTPWMPKLNLNNAPTRKYLLDIAKKWIVEADIDGWRLDAADEVDPGYWRDFRKVVKGAKPDAFIVGECWKDASPWLQGDQWDSTMNYRWRGAVLDFFAFGSKKPSEFEAQLTKIREDYPPSATAVMFNMISSHDVERFRTLCKGDRTRQLMATLFQLTYPGTPCLYYGDEIGMEGGRDPDNRRAFEWDDAKWDKETLLFTQQAIALRQDHVSLRRGEYRNFVQDDGRGLFGFLRVHEKETCLTVFNRSDKTQILALPASPKNAKVWITGANVATVKAGKVILPPGGMAVVGL